MSIQEITATLAEKVSTAQPFGKKIKFSLDGQTIHLDGTTTPPTVSNDEKPADVTISGDAWVALTVHGTQSVPGLATGPDIVDTLTAAGASIEAYRWVYGPAQRGQPENPGEMLNGDGGNFGHGGSGSREVSNFPARGKSDRAAGMNSCRPPSNPFFTFPLPRRGFTMAMKRFSPWS